jgi:hypothetical protein
MAMLCLKGIYYHTSNNSKNMKCSILQIACLVLLSSLLGSCAGGDKKRPPRKQLPTLNDDVSWEGSYGRNLNSGYETGLQGKPYYYVRDTVVAGNSFISLSMPDPGGDSLAWVMVRSYEPFASGAFLLMQQQGKKGAYINFRSSGDDPRSASYLAKDMLGNSLSLIFLWDRQSGPRASEFINELQKLPAVQCTAISQ